MFSGAELPFPRLERQGGVDGCVKYSDADVDDYLLPDGTVCDGRPPVLLKLCEISWAQSLIFFPGNVEDNWKGYRKVRSSVLILRVGCPSCQEIQYCAHSHAHAQLPIRCPTPALPDATPQGPRAPHVPRVTSQPRNPLSVLELARSPELEHEVRREVTLQVMRWFGQFKQRYGTIGGGWRLKSGESSRPGYCAVLCVSTRFVPRCLFPAVKPFLA